MTPASRPGRVIAQFTAEDAEDAEVAEDGTPDLLLITTSPDGCFGNDLGKPIRTEVVSSPTSFFLRFRGYSAAAA